MARLGMMWCGATCVVLQAFAIPVTFNVQLRTA